MRLKFNFMKIISSLCLLFLLISFSHPAKAQETIEEGKITYEITYPEMEMDEQMKAMMPTESVVYIKGALSRTETAMGMGISSATIMNAKTNEVIALMDMMGTKTATVMQDEEAAKKRDKSGDDELTFTLVDETKMIAGVLCKKAIMKNSDGTEFEMYYTETIDSKSQFSKQWRKFKGFPMEYVVTSAGFTMKMTAKTITKEKVADELFKIPADYKIMTQEEFTKMMGGQ